MGQQIQVISADGTYAAEGVEAFIQDRDVSQAGVKYTTVAIMGPQSSGKSTLLNAVVRSVFFAQCW
jgi:ABC-type lipoprotein export system ATPase subunit